MSEHPSLTMAGLCVIGGIMGFASESATTSDHLSLFFSSLFLTPFPFFHLTFLTLKSVRDS